MRIAQSGLNDLFVAFGAKDPELEIANVRCPTQNPPAEFGDPDADGLIEGTKGWSWVANHSDDGMADIEVIVEVISGPHQGTVSGWLDPDVVDVWLASLDTATAVS